MGADTIYNLKSSMTSPFHFMIFYSGFPVLIYSTLILSMTSFIMWTKNFFMMTLVFLVVFNGSSLTPFSFSMTAYFWSNILITMILCGLMMGLKFSKFFMKFLSSMVPLGCPMFLWGLLANLEVTSILIQPFTLALRLSCNLMAGHVMLHLMSASNYFLLGLIIFLVFEAMVSCIQSHVFSLLLASYLK